MESRLTHVALVVVGLWSFGLMLRPSCGQLLLKGPAQPQATGRGPIATPEAVLKKREAEDWAKVCAADAAEIAGLHAASTAAMKAGDANAVVAVQRWLQVVKGRLAQEKVQRPFLPFFQPAGPTAGLAAGVLQLELARNKAVAAAVAQWRQAQAAYGAAVVMADRREVAVLEARVKAAMKAGDASAVVAAMARLKQAQQQLQRGSPGAFGRPAFWGGSNGSHGNGSGAGGAGSGGGVSGSAGTASGGGSAAPRRDWPKMVQQANAPVAAGSVFAIGPALENDPHLLVGGRVTWHIGTGLGLALSGKQLAQWRRLRLEIRRHFRAIRQAAARRDAAEYRYQLQILEQANPNAPAWQVAWPIKHAEQIERAKVSRLAKKEEHADIKALDRCFRVPRLQVRLVGPKGVAVPTSGPIYGVILAAHVVARHPETPEFSLPSGVSVRMSAFGPMAALQFVPFPRAGTFLSNVPAMEIPAMPVGAEKVEHMTILYCGRYPHYKRSGGIAHRGHGYEFMMKNGSTLRVTAYTSGQSYYHAVWDGVAMPIAKNLVLKIKPQ